MARVPECWVPPTCFVRSRVPEYWCAPDLPSIQETPSCLINHTQGAARPLARVHESLMQSPSCLLLLLAFVGSNHIPPV